MNKEDVRARLLWLKSNSLINEQEDLNEALGDAIEIVDKALRQEEEWRWSGQFIAVMEEKAVDMLTATGWLDKHDEKVQNEAANLKGVDCTDFLAWLYDEVCDEEDWRWNSDAYGEIICRKLKKLGILEVRNGYYCVVEDNRHTAEWLPKNSHTNYCSHCYFEETDWHTSEYDFCPKCGAKIVREKDED